RSNRPRGAGRVVTSPGRPGPALRRPRPRSRRRRPRLTGVLARALARPPTRAPPRPLSRRPTRLPSGPGRLHRPSGPLRYGRRGHPVLGGPPPGARLRPRGDPGRPGGDGGVRPPLRPAVVPRRRAPGRGERVRWTHREWILHRQPV